MGTAHGSPCWGTMNGKTHGDTVVHNDSSLLHERGMPV